MFLAASAIRALLSCGVAIRGSFVEQLAAGSAFGAHLDLQADRAGRSAPPWSPSQLPVAVAGLHVSGALR